MHCRLQLGVRENPASDRRHGSRQGLRDVSDGNYAQQDNVEQSEPTAGLNLSFSHGDATNAARPHAATVGKSEQTELSPEAITGTSSRSSAHPFEPLIASPAAARLLGNIHVKTLQRYARRGSLPGYQIGGHWYFRVSELDSWLRSQINSSCHPCRLSKEAK